MRQGLHRVWVVLSVTWVITVAAVYWYRTPYPYHDGHWWVGSSWAATGSPVAEEMHEYVTEAFFVTLAPPVIIYVLVAALAWACRPMFKA